jgi:TonB-dependent starch-binding outer membrane protein SusC
MKVFQKFKFIRHWTIITCLFVFLGSLSLWGQEFRVSGTVTDQNTGEPLPGVNIVESGTFTGVVTNIDGEYSLTVSGPQAVLVFSFVGYVTEEVQVNNREVVNVNLIQDIRALDEIVVIGYGTQRRSDLTGSVASVSEDRLRATISTSIDQALQGMAAGVQVFQNSGQPGGGVSLRIRGTSSIHSTSEPLYVIDGVAVSGNAQGLSVGFSWAGGGDGQTAVSALATINPADIVSVEVLKDASASAIYGSRAANGVVLITTRRGQLNESRINYETYYGIQQPSKWMDVMDLRQYADYYNEMAEAGWFAVREQYLDPSLLGAGTDWQNEVFRNAGIVNHQLSVSGGTDNTTYAVSAGYFDQDGIVIGSNFNRYSLRINLDNQAKSWIRVGNTLAVSRTNERITINDSDDGIIARTLTQSPDVPVRYADGSWGGPLESQFGVSNPVAMALDRENTLTRTRVMGNIYAEANFLNNFTFRSEFGGDLQNNNNYAFNPTYQYGLIINDINQSRRRYAQNLYWEVKNYLTYNETFMNRHNVTAMIGQEASESNWEGLLGQRTSFLSNSVQELNAGDASTAINEGYRGSAALSSYFGRINYNFDNRYYLTATFRADGSSNFGPENRWGYFPSFALAWRVSNEAFMSNLDNVISNLRLRASYGEIGNQNIGGYRYGSSLSAAPGGLGQTFRLNSIPNPLVKWEATRSTNLALELALFDYRVELMVDVYQQKTDDMLLVLPLPNYLGSGHWMGIGSPWVNIGELENRGLEIALNTRNIARTGFSWNSDFIFSHNRNKVLSLGDEGAAIYQTVQWFNTVTKTEAGYPIGQFYGYVVDKVFESHEEILNSPTQHANVDPITGVWMGDIKFKDINGDGVIDDADRQYIGDPNPLFTFGFNNSLRWANFDLGVYLQGSYGNKIFNFTRRQTEGMFSGYSNQLATVNDRTRVRLIDPDGDLSDPANYTVTVSPNGMPRATSTNPNNNTRISDRYVEDGSYVRIQNVTLGYRLPARLGSRFAIEELRVYASIQNLYTFTNYTGYDPEIGNYNQNSMLMGIDNGRYPLPRMMTLGLNVGF